MSNIKNYIINYCRDSGCQVQKSFDQHKAQGVALEELKWIKDSHCVRCDVYRFRKWLEAQDLNLVEKDEKLTPM